MRVKATVLGGSPVAEENIRCADLESFVKDLRAPRHCRNPQSAASRVVVGDLSDIAQSLR
jgi:hypothetical protein